MEEIKENFILPAVILKVGKFVGLDSDNKVLMNATEKPYALCRTLEGKVVLVKFLCNKNDVVVNTEFLDKFFKDRAKSKVKNKDVIVVTKALSKSKEFKAEIKPLLSEEKARLLADDVEMDELIDKVIEFEAKQSEDRAREILENDKCIKEGDFIRVPLSTNDDLGECRVGDKSYPIYESLSILLNGDRTPHVSGLYHIISNRNQLPVVYEKNQNSDEAFKMGTRLNTILCNKDMILTLFQHSVRTTNETDSYFLRFYPKKDSMSSEYMTLIDKINSCGGKEHKDTYLSNMNSLIEMVKESESDKISSFVNCKIYLPISVDKSFIYDDDSLIRKLGESLFNVSFRLLNRDSKEEYIEKFNKHILDRIQNNKLYGTYSILSAIPNTESDTYGFLKNNMHTSSLMFGLRDTLLLYKFLDSEFKDEYIEKAPREKKAPIDNMFSADGSLEF